MGDEGNVSFESMYNGGVSSFDPSYGNFSGYRMSFGGISSTTSPQTANQIGEVVARLKEGVKNVELQPIIADTFETIPKQHFEEIRALMKISGASPSLHAPLLDPAGFSERGGWDEATRDENERRFMNVIEKAHILDPNGNIPIVFHSAGSGTGTEYRPGDEKKGEERFHLIKSGIINQETGQLQAVKEEKTYSPGMSVDQLRKGGKIMGVYERIDNANETDWEQKITTLAHGINESQKVLTDVATYGGADLIGMDPNTLDDEKKSLYGHALGKIKQAELFIRNNQQIAGSIFDKAYDYGSNQQKEILEDLSQNYMKELKKIGEKNKDPYSAMVEQTRIVDSFVSSIGQVTSGRNLKTGEEDSENWGAPKINIAAEEFASKKAAETFGNLAYKSYEKFGSSSPIIAIENLFPGLGYSTGEDVKKLVEQARDKFVDTAVGKGMDKKEAKKEAERLIGVTWDVGHMNISKKYGFNDKDIIEETKKIAPYVKHVHLTDNFGYADTHLAPGMGNVPIKEILQELEKTGRLGDMKKVIEAGGLVNPQMGLKMSPLKATMSSFGSPIYGAAAGPYWNQAAGLSPGGGYFGGPLAYMPEKHFSMYGSGFSSLPTELGGQMPGNASRVSGAPMS